MLLNEVILVIGRTPRVWYVRSLFIYFALLAKTHTHTLRYDVITIRSRQNGERGASVW